MAAAPPAISQESGVGVFSKTLSSFLISRTESEAAGETELEQTEHKKLQSLQMARQFHLLSLLDLKFPAAHSHPFPYLLLGA